MALQRLGDADPARLHLLTRNWLGEDAPVHGYCWSGAVAAAPATGFPRLERWAASRDPDVRWVVGENFTRARLRRADPTRTSRLAAVLAPG